MVGLEVGLTGRGSPSRHRHCNETKVTDMVGQKSNLSSKKMYLVSFEVYVASVTRAIVPLDKVLFPERFSSFPLLYPRVGNI